MDGITILSEHFCRGVELSGLIIGGIFITIIVVFGLLYIRYILKDLSGVIKNITTLFYVILVALYIHQIWGLISSHNTTHTEYTITIDDSVSFNDFFNKYEILKVDGDIYRVIEK